MLVSHIPINRCKVYTQISMNILAEGQYVEALSVLIPALAGLVVLYLFITLVRTRAALRRIEKSKLNVSFAPKMSLLSADFSNFPHPLCLVDSKGKILWQNDLFTELSNSDNMSCIEDFDQHTGANLVSFLESPSLHNRSLSLRPASESPAHAWRQFQIVDWPASERRNEQQRFIALEEQTTQAERMMDHFQFEQQFVHYLHSTAKRLRDQVVRNHTNPDPVTAELSDELLEMSGVLESSYSKLRTPAQFGAIDIGGLCLSVLRDIRPTLGKKRVQLLTTFPFKSCVMASYHDLEFALRSLFGGLATESKSGDILRIHMSKKGKKIVIRCNLSSAIFKPAELTDLFHFGAHAEGLPIKRRVLRLEISLIKQLLVKQHGTLHVHADRETGTDITLSFPVAGETAA